MLYMSGSGGDVGYDYQADGTAFVAVHGISGQPLGWFDDFNDVPSEWSAETGGAGDDLRVVTREGHVIEVQAKHALKRGEDYINAFRRLVSGLKSDPQLRGIVLVDRHASANIRDDLKQDILRIGAGRSDDLKEITLELLRDLGETANAISDVFARLRIIVVDLDEGADGVRLACALLGRIVLPDKATIAFQWLGKRYHGIIKRRSRDTATKCLAALKNQLGLAYETTLASGYRPNVVASVLESQLENMSAHLAQDAETELEVSRSAWRSGRKSDAATSIARLRAPTRWHAYPDELRAKILRFQSLLALDAGDIPASRSFADQAEQIAPGANTRLLALLARAGGDLTGAFSQLANANDAESATLRSALLLESGKIEDALTELRPLQSDPEACRLRALAHVLQHDLGAARLEIEKASQLAPSWHAVVQSKMVIEYLSGLSPAVFPPGIPAWAEPVEWAFIKTGDEDRAHFLVAADAATRLLREGESGPEERRILEAWKVASLANDPDQLAAASICAKDMLSRDPSNYLIMAWASARALDVDLTTPAELLQKRLLAGDGSVHEAITLLEKDLVSGQFEAALRLLEATDQLFATSGNSHLWRLFRAQITARRPDLARAVLTPTEADLTAVGAKLAHLHTLALLTGDWNPLISELRIQSDVGDGRPTFELCKLLGGQQKWTEAAPYARLLPQRIQTAESIRLAAITLFNAGQEAECLKLLDSHRSWFPNGRLGTELHRLRVAAARRLGLVPTATASAEEIFAREPSRSNFLLLGQLYFEKGDFALLAALSRNSYEKVGLLAADLLRLAVWLSHEDPRIAVDMWRRAMSLGVADEEVTIALDAAYKLGLDAETRPIVERLPRLSNEQVKRFDLQEVQAFLLEQRSSMEHAYELYRRGDIPVHLLAQAMNRPLSWWYHRALLENEKAGQSAAGPTLARHGWRATQATAWDNRAKPRLHADLTALLTAAHLEVLADVEKAFCPILLPRQTLVALVAIRDRAMPVQPARQLLRRAVTELVRQKQISVVELGASASAVTLRRARESEFCDAAKKGWLVVDYPSPHENDAVPPPHNQTELAQFMRSPHSVRDALVELGEISKEDGDRATERLGQELRFPGERTMPRGGGVLVGGTCLETLADAGLLVPATRAFKVLISKDDWDSLNAEMSAFETAAEDADWLSELIHRLNRGVDSGTYELIPISGSLPADGEEHSADSLEKLCLMDLFLFSPTENDVIWVDDRWMSGFAHRNAVPIVGTPDVLHAMRKLGAISDVKLFDFLHRLREDDFRLLTFSGEELQHHLQGARATERGLVETRQLRTLRHYYARCLSDGAILRITPNEQGAGVEWPFLMGSASSVLEVLLNTTHLEDSSGLTFARMEWLLRNLYAPDKGRAFTTAARDSQLDLRMEALGLASFLAGPAAISFKDVSGRRTRRNYLDWIYSRLLRRRFDVDPLLRAASLDVFKNIVSQSMTSISNAAHQPYAAALVIALLEDMPEDLSEAVSADSEFIRSIGVPTHAVIRFGEERIPADAFWNGVTQAMQSGTPSIIEVGSDRWSVSIQTEDRVEGIVVEKNGANPQYILAEAVELMSDSVADRERALRSTAQSFDLPQADTEAAIARLSLISNLGKRMEEFTRIRRGSAVLLYRELTTKLRNQEPVGDGDFLNFDVELLLRHLRISGTMTGSVGALISDAASCLLNEVGLAETICRMAGLPTALPRPVLVTLQSMSAAARKLLFKSLLKSIGNSPLGSSHIAKLMDMFRAESPAYARYARSVATKLSSRSGEPLTAWIAVLRYVADGFMFLDQYRVCSPDLRLIACWCHADRLYRILRAVGVEDQVITKRFTDRPDRLPAEMIFGRDDFTKDTVYPRNLEVFPTGLALAWHSANGAKDILDVVAGDISAELNADMSKAVTLLGASRPRLNALDSFVAATWFPLLRQQLQGELAYDALQARCEEVLLGFASGTSKVEEWAFVQSVLGDDAAPIQFQPMLRAAILATNFEGILDGAEQSRLPVLVSVARQAAILGDDVIVHVRAQLLRLTKSIAARAKATNAKDREDMIDAVLSAAFELYRADRPNENNYTELSVFLWDLVSQWWEIAETCQRLVDALVQGLPNAHSRLFWQLQIRLRAVR